VTGDIKMAVSLLQFHYYSDPLLANSVAEFCHMYPEFPVALIAGIYAVFKAPNLEHSAFQAFTP